MKKRISKGASGIGMVKTFVPGGEMIAPALDKIISSFMNKRPSLTDISDLQCTDRQISAIMEDTEINEINGRMFDLEKINSVVTHLDNYDTMDRLVYLNNGTAQSDYFTV